MTARCLLMWMVCASAWIPAGTVWADLNWQDWYSSGDPIVNGSSAVSDGVTATFGVTMYQTRNGDMAPFPGFNDYVLFYGGTQGGISPYVFMGFDNRNNDPRDYVEFSVTFSEAVNQLSFTIMDVDVGSFKDAVEIYYNGINVKGSSYVSWNSAVVPDNESYMEGYEGNANVAPTSSAGNIMLNFGSTAVSSFRIKFFSSDDAQSNPGAQLIGLSALGYDPVSVPEPSAGVLALVGLGACGLLAAYRRRSQAADHRASRDRATS